MQFGQQVAMQPVWTIELGQYMLSQQPVITQLFIFLGPQVPIMSLSGASQNRYAPISSHKMDVDKEPSIQLTTTEESEPVRE